MSLCVARAENSTFSATVQKNKQTRVLTYANKTIRYEKVKTL